MRKLMLKIATAALLVLTSAVGIALQHAEPAFDTERVAAGAITSAFPLEADTSATSWFNAIAHADQPREISASIDARPVDLIAAGVCAAIVGCCMLGLALLRLRFRGDPQSFWTTVPGHRMVPSTRPAAPLTSAIRPSLILLSISRI